MLRETFPDGRFQAPASEEGISSVEVELSIRFPDQLRSLYLECDGFREHLGNAKYLLSLRNEDFIGSLVTISRYFWTEVSEPDLRPFVFFGSSSAGEWWGIRLTAPHDVIAYHHSMDGEYEAIGSSILEIYVRDLALYDESGG